MDAKFHIHVDAAVLPTEFEAFAKNELGFFDDDFTHTLVIDGQERPARHLTRKFYESRDRDTVREICEILAEKAKATGLRGYIQAEFVMREIAIPTGCDFSHTRSAGWRLEPHRPDPVLGEAFKSHELHVELNSAGNFQAAANLEERGLRGTLCKDEIIFTASGARDDILQLESRLAIGEDSSKATIGHLKVEATVFYSLHGIDVQNTPIFSRFIDENIAPTSSPLSERDIATEVNVLNRMQ